MSHNTNHPTQVEVQTVVLVGIQTPGISDLDRDSSLKELAQLVKTLGYRVIGQLHQKRANNRNATVLGEGKLKELALWTGGTGEIAPIIVKKKHKAALRQEAEKVEAEEDATEAAEWAALEARADALEREEQLLEPEPETQEDSAEIEAPKELAQVAIFDCDLSPSQGRNLESALGVQVLDRTGVIIEIFSRHARTKAARMQVEIARLKYQAPRLRETSESQRGFAGGIGGKGSGETGIELDKRRIRDRVKELRNQTEEIAVDHQARRSRREEETCVALVGYTNAGKSSLMRAMTGTEVYIANKLFATLDTTVRPVYPETRPKILLSDTVGFIKKLPHDLVASFRSTLDEALNASLLLFVVDAADPSFRSQLKVTMEVLKDIGAGDIPHKVLFNKCDLLTDEQRLWLKREFKDAILLSAMNLDDISRLRDTLVEFFEQDMLEEEIFIPYKAKGFIGEIRARMRVVSENYDGDGVRLLVRATPEDLNRLKSRLPEEEDEF